MVPVIFLGKGLIKAVVKVLVVGEDDVPADIVELCMGLASAGGLPDVARQGTYEALWGDIGGGKTTGLLIGVDNQP